MQTAISKVVNSAKVLSCWLKFVRGTFPFHIMPLQVAKAKKGRCNITGVLGLKFANENTQVPTLFKKLKRFKMAK